MELPAASEGMPATYEIGGRQFIALPVAPGTGQFAAQAPGRKTLVITVSGKKDLPDPNGLERAYALPDARFDQLPLGRRDQPRDQVEREDPLLAVMGEGDTLIAVAAIPCRRPLRQVVAGDRLEGVVQRPHVRMRQPVSPEHVVVGWALRVPVEEPSHAWIRTTDLFLPLVVTVGKQW